MIAESVKKPICQKLCFLIKSAAIPVKNDNPPRMQSAVITQWPAGIKVRGVPVLSLIPLMTDMHNPNTNNNRTSMPQWIITVRLCKTRPKNNAKTAIRTVEIILAVLPKNSFIMKNLIRLIIDNVYFDPEISFSRIWYFRIC